MRRQAAAVDAQIAAVRQQGGSAAGFQEAIARQRAAAELQVRRALTQSGGPPGEAGQPPSCDRLPPQEAESLVSSAAAREGLGTDVLRAVIERESGFRPCAVSPKGALGLMQLMPSTAGDLGVKDAFDAVENANSGARLLAHLLERYRGDLPLALAAYNAGPARVDAQGGIPDIPETRDYVRAILGSLAGR